MGLDGHPVAGAWSLWVISGELFGGGSDSAAIADSSGNF